MWQMKKNVLSIIFGAIVSSVFILVVSSVLFDTTVCQEPLWGVIGCIELSAIYLFGIACIAAIVAGIIMQWLKSPHPFWIASFATFEGILLKLFLTSSLVSTFNILLMFGIFITTFLTNYVLFNVWSARLRYKLVASCIICALIVAIFLYVGVDNNIVCPCAYSIFNFPSKMSV